MSGIRRLGPFYKSLKLRSWAIFGFDMRRFRFSQGAVHYVGVMLVVEKESSEISRHGSSL